MRASEVSERVLGALRQIIRAIDVHSRKLVLEYGLTGTQLLILKVAGASGEVAVGEIAKRVSLSPATVTGVLDRLEKRGYVERTRDHEDKRRMMVRVTSGGKGALEGAPPLLQEHFVARFGELAEWEQTLLLSSLQRVAAMMETEEMKGEGLIVAEPLSAAAQETVDVIDRGVQTPAGSGRGKSA